MVPRMEIADSSIASDSSCYHGGQEEKGCKSGRMPSGCSSAPGSLQPPEAARRASGLGDGSRL